MITMFKILLFIAILSIAIYLLDINFVEYFEEIKHLLNSQQNKSKKSSPSGEGYYGAIDRYCETVKKVFGKKENLSKSTEFFTRPKFFGEKEYLPIQGRPVTTHLFNVPIPFNTNVNILKIVGLDNYRWIVDSDNSFELNIRNQKLDISDICTIDAATRTLLFFIGDNKFILNVDFDSGEAIIKTNSKEFESEFAVLTFEAKSLEAEKATLGLTRMTQKTLEEFKIGDIK